MSFRTPAQLLTTCLCSYHRAMTRIHPPWEERLWAKIEVGASWECWPITGHRSKGYGRLKVNGTTQRAHRLVWIYTYGPIPPGLKVLHHCDNPPCCNPEHLFLGTDADNMNDKVVKGRHGNTQKIRCPQGHPYDEANTYITPDGRRNCRICRREVVRAQQAKKAP